jgi:hypothetical protein
MVVARHPVQLLAYLASYKMSSKCSFSPEAERQVREADHSHLSKAGVENGEDISPPLH